MQTLEHLRRNSPKFDKALERAVERLGKPSSAFESAPSDSALDEAAESVRSGGGGGFEGPQGALEAIILDELRPAYLIENDRITIHGDFDHIDIIETNKPMLEDVSKNVGRVDLLNHATMAFVGTGWLISEDIVVTNRHVAQAFAEPAWSGGWVFAPGRFGDPLRVDINFVRQHSAAADLRRTLTATEVLYVAPTGSPDIAFLRVVANPALTPVSLRATPARIDMPVAAVGYPAWDGRRNDAKLMGEIFGDIFDVKRFAPGMVTGTAQDRVVLHCDYSSLGGNSGSALLDLETGEAVGLHFAGVFRETNYAVASDIVAAALRDISAPVVAVATPPQITEAPDLADRAGYDPDFLEGDATSVPLPGLGARADDLAPVSGDANGHLNYTHFTVLQSASRRLPMLTAVNIDGARAFALKRRGDWRLDGRLDRELQIGNELYRHNPLDRGHMVRRKDPGWGDTREEAEMAERDTFHYTNCAPQHQDLNQRDWLGLEDYILENSDTRDFKVSVMTGPVFGDEDRTLRAQPGAETVAIPESFWKVAVMVNETSGKLSATGYLLTQGTLIRDLVEAAFVLGEYKTYQVPLHMIEALTGFDWGRLLDHDPLNTATENLFAEAVRRIDGPESLTL